MSEHAKNQDNEILQTQSIKLTKAKGREPFWHAHARISKTPKTRKRYYRWHGQKWEDHPPHPPYCLHDKIYKISDIKYSIDRENRDGHGRWFVSAYLPSEASSANLDLIVFNLANSRDSECKGAYKYFKWGGERGGSRLLPEQSRRICTGLLCGSFGEPLNQTSISKCTLVNYSSSCFRLWYVFLSL